MNLQDVAEIVSAWSYLIISAWSYIIIAADIMFLITSLYSNYQLCFLSLGD